MTDDQDGSPLPQGPGEPAAMLEMKLPLSAEARKLMDVKPLKRAFELAKSGRFRTTSEISTRLREEGLSDPIEHHNIIVAHLDALIREAKRQNSKAVVSPRSLSVR
jgi:hypothetical protein